MQPPLVQMGLWMPSGPDELNPQSDPHTRVGKVPTWDSRQRWRPVAAWSLYRQLVFVFSPISGQPTFRGLTYIPWELKLFMSSG